MNQHHIAFHIANGFTRVCTFKLPQHIEPKKGSTALLTRKEHFMKLKILKTIITEIIIPWFGSAAKVIVKGFKIGGMLIIYLPFAIVAGLIKLYKHEVWKGKHPPR